MATTRPVFLIGPGRSGTTLLYKIFSLHPDIGYISNFDIRTPRWMLSAMLSRLIRNAGELKLWAWFNKGGNAWFVNRPWTKKIVPTPAEGEELYARCGVTLDEYTSVPQQEIQQEILHRLRKEFTLLQRRQRAKILLLKRTANNRRIPCLDAAFPNARYINLIRDGRDVAHSLVRVNWWNDHPVWWAGNRTPRQLAQEGMDMLYIAARNWTEEVRAIERGMEALNQQNVYNLRYEDFLRKPMEHVLGILAFMDLEPSAKYKDAILSLGLSERQEPSSKWTESDLKTVMTVEGQTLTKLGYI